MTRLCILGGGRMGSALLGGLVRNGWIEPEDCVVAEVDSIARATLQERFPGLHVSPVPLPADSLVLAVKPSDAAAACGAIDRSSYQRVLSIMAGVTIADLESWLWKGASVVRAMPNTPALLGMGASAIAPGTATSDEDLDWAEEVLSAVGVVVRLPEKLLDAATGLSGSGPAYLFLVAEALVDAGVHVGLDREVARILTVQTLLGSARMLAETGESAEVLRGWVTSPGGTTAAGLQTLEEHATRAAFIDAVAAATKRSKELAAGG